MTILNNITGDTYQANRMAEIRSLLEDSIDGIITFFDSEGLEIPFKEVMTQLYGN